MVPYTEPEKIQGRNRLYMFYTITVGHVGCFSPLIFVEDI